MPFLPQPKPRPSALARADRRKARAAIDKSESAKVKSRSGGRCEVRELVRVGLSTGIFRCDRKALHVHHRLGGIGVRGRGKSALSEWKLAVCRICHSEIHSHILVPDGNTFTRVK